jgi:hypothetical protein
MTVIGILAQGIDDRLGGTVCHDAVDSAEDPSGRLLWEFLAGVLRAMPPGNPKDGTIGAVIRSLDDFGVGGVWHTEDVLPDDYLDERYQAAFAASWAMKSWLFPAWWLGAQMATVCAWSAMCAAENAGVTIEKQRDILLKVIGEGRK